MSAFAGLTEELCQKAFDLWVPMFDQAADTGIIKRREGCLMVCDPTTPWEPKYKLEEGFRDDVVLFEISIENTENWQHPYDEHALAKAFVSWKTGLPAYQVQQQAPYLFEEGMSKYGGSAVGPGGLVVAFSGVEEYFDQMLSEMMLAAIKGLCLHEVYGPAGLMADDSVEFLG